MQKLNVDTKKSTTEYYIVSHVSHSIVDYIFIHNGFIPMNLQCYYTLMYLEHSVFSFIQFVN